MRSVAAYAVHGHPEKKIPKEYFCEVCKPENHKVLLEAMERGERPRENGGGRGRGRTPRVCVFPEKPGVPGGPHTRTRSWGLGRPAASPVSPPSRPGTRFLRCRDLAPGCPVAEPGHPSLARCSRRSARATVWRGTHPMLPPQRSRARPRRRARSPAWLLV